MPWKESNAMSERMKFVLRLEDGEKMTDICREFGISRKTGYKIWNRYQEVGSIAFLDQPKRPIRLANETDKQIVDLILNLKQERPTWGAPKILEYLIRKKTHVKFPTRSTVHAILDRVMF